MSQYQAVVELSSLDGTNGFQINGEAAGDLSGQSVSSAGDVNGDGFADLIVGASGANPNGSDSGASYVVFGKASGFGAALELSSLDGNNGFQINGDEFDFTGRPVSSAGDVNGDGYDDVIIGGPIPKGFGPGAAYVVFGKASGFGATLELFSLDGTNGFQINGEAADDRCGYSVSSAGDVNGDGFGDLIVGAFAADPNGSRSGASYVVFGKAAGFGASLSLGLLDGNNGFQINGESFDDFSGSAVSSAGDVNGDGFDDLIVGADFASTNGFYSGASYVVFGKASGFGATLELSSLDGSNGFEFYGEAAFDRNGISVSSAGDVNGDGFTDLIVGAHGADPNGSASGASYVVFGKASGFGGLLLLSSLDGNNGFQINGEAANDESGVSVSDAGDFNGDGFADLIVGAPNADPNGSKSGASYVLFGTASGFGATLELSSLDGNNGFKINGEAGADRSGGSVSGAGDVNGDGFDDLIVGASGGDPNGSGSGASYVILGSMPGESVTRTGTDIANTINGGNFKDTLSGLGGDDLLFAQGGNDKAFGGDGRDALDGGDGDDTLGGGEGNDELNGRDGKDTLNGGSNDDSLAGGRATDTLNGGSGNDTLKGGEGHDTLDGGTGLDRFVFIVATESSSVNYDTIKKADFAADAWDVRAEIFEIDPTITTGSLSSGEFDIRLAAAADADHLFEQHAVLFTPTSGNLSGKTFLIVDQNGAAGYQAGEDLVMELKASVNLASIDAGDFI
jgi:hypothetical protein